MNNPTLRQAVERLGDGEKILIVDGGNCIVFDECDFSEGGDVSDHVCLYLNRTLIGVIDMRSVSGVVDYPFPSGYRSHES